MIGKLLLPRKSGFDAIAESGTTTVWFPRVHSYPKKYIYGKTPELYEAQKTGKCFHPHGIPKPIVHGQCKVNWQKQLGINDSSYFAKCEPKESGGDEIWKLCRLLKNPKRMELLVKLYRECQKPSDCINVSAIQCSARLELAATSEYLKDLMQIGLLQRKRCAQEVVYYPDLSRAKPAVRKFGIVLRSQLISGKCDFGFTCAFPSLSNASRAKAIKLLSDFGALERSRLCEMLNKNPKNLSRDLLRAKKDGLIDYGSEDDDAIYTYLPPTHPVIQMLVDLVE